MAAASNGAAPFDIYNQLAGRLDTQRAART
jgi:hypothetical protein